VNVAELVGGVLYHSDDPDEAARSLAAILLEPAVSEERIRAAGLDPELVDVLRRTLPSDPVAITTACSVGAAWVRGQRSVRRADPWEAVVTLSPSTPFPYGIRRGTTETLVTLITSARERITISAPFIDEVGLNYLSTPLALATKRGVHVDLILSNWNSPIERAVLTLHAGIARQGDSALLRIRSIAEPGPWPHLKVLSVDGASAYIGSANLTEAGLAGRNIELGVLVRGAQVQAIERILNLIKTEVREVG
jgi:phosphatidylserine/phosphatidylglycerophosphate/cardiolipin synthase-like enzyme